MSIRQNIFISVLIHTLIITSALITGGKIRDAACRIPEDHIIVSLFKEMGDIARDKITKQSQHIRRDIMLSKDTVNLPDPISTANERSQASSLSIPEGQYPVSSVEIKMSYASTKSNENNPPMHSFSTNPSIPTFSNNPPVTFNPSFALIREAIEKAKTYPYFARKKKIEGTVITEFSINNKGYPQDITVRKSSGSEILDSAAMNIIKKAAPFPLVDGHIVIPITFSLRDVQFSE